MVKEAAKEMLSVAYGVLRSVVFALDELIYKFIIILYDIFERLCSAKLLDSDVIVDFSRRIGLILGLVMFFYVAFDFVQLLLEPDKISDKEKGPVNIIKKCAIVIVLLGTSSLIFNTLTDFQNSIVKSGTIEKLILPYEVDTDNFGFALSEQLMTSFYTLTDDPNASVGDKKDEYTYEDCKEYVEVFQNQILTMGEFSLGRMCLNERYEYMVNSNGKSKTNIDYFINFNFLSLVVGLAVAWMLLMYCISVGMRIVQLTILQMISPMAIVSYLSPKKDTMLSKWFKIYVATYIDVFIRIAIINIVVYLCAVILDNWDSSLSTFWSSVGSPTGATKVWIGIFMIIALLSFAKKAPDLIKQLLPESASKLGFGLGLKDHAGLGMIGGALTAGVTGVVGGIAGGKGKTKISGAIGGLFGGVGRGFSSGAKAKDLRSALTEGSKNQAKVNLARAQEIGAGMTSSDRLSNRFRGALGMEVASARDTRDIDTLNAYANLEDTIEGYANQNSDIKRLKRDYEAIRDGGPMDGERQEDYTHRVEVARKKLSAAREHFITAAMSGNVGTGNFQYEYEVDGVKYKSIYHIDAENKDRYNIENIQFGRDELNRMHKEHKRLFSGYSDVNNYDSMDNNVIHANSDLARLSSKRRRSSGK